MRCSATIGTILAALLFASPLIPADSGVIGVVKTVKGTVSLIRDQQTAPATVGAKIKMNDAFQTGPDGSVGLILRDDAVLSLGPDSKIVIDQFLFSPAEGKLGFLVRILRGTAVYLSGIIGKLSPGSAKFETPVATIGIRGTRFAVKVGPNESERRAGP